MAELIETSEFERHGEAMISALGPALGALGRRMRARLTRRMRGHILPKGGTPGKRVSGNRIGNRSRKLWDALEEGKSGALTKYVIDADGLLIETGIDDSLVPYAIAHEKGATIRPRNAGALTIPVSQEAVDMLDAVGGNIRALDLFVIQTRTGLLALAKKFGGSIRTLFLLLKKVVIPARPFSGPGVEDFATADLPEFAEDFGEDILEAWEST